MSAPLVEPSACTWCGIARRGHARQYADAVGWHAWARPTDAQVLARMKARRLAVTVARVGALPMPVSPEPQPRTMLDRARDALNARMAKDDLRLVLENVIGYAAWLEAERHSTNESLSEAAETLRANRDRITELEARLAEREQPADTYPPALPWARLMDHEDLADFLDELAASAITHASAEVALTEVESTCGRWREIAEAQHAHNTAPGPGADDVVPQVTKLRAVLAEDPARCLKVHPFSPRDGWRIICANCDHIRYAPCHEGGDR